MGNSIFSRETIITVIINIGCGLLVLLLTKSVLYAILTLLSLIALFVIFFNVRKYYIISSVSKIKNIHPDSRDPKSLLQRYFTGGWDVRILALRGALILGSDRGSISQIIKELPKGWNGKIRILLLDPESDFLKERALELNHDPIQFKEQCLATAKNISALKKKYQVNISLRYYNMKPLWRLILIDNRGFISYYLGERGHTTFHYEIIAGEGSFFNAFSLFFEQLWQVSRDCCL